MWGDLGGAALMSLGVGQGRGRGGNDVNIVLIYEILKKKFNKINQDSGCSRHYLSCLYSILTKC